MSESIDRDILLVVEAFQHWCRAFDKYAPAKCANFRKRYQRRWNALPIHKRDEATERMNKWLEENPSGE